MASSPTFATVLKVGSTCCAFTRAFFCCEAAMIVSGEMLTVIVSVALAGLRCWRTKLQLAVLMLLASWLKGSGEDVSFSNEMAKWPRSTFWHRLKSFGNVASGLYFALPLPLLAGV